MISYLALKNIIDSWDPIDFFPFAPNDEYEAECNIIYKKVIELEKSSADIETLTLIVQNIFSKSFGDTVFLKSYEDCRIVSLKILELL